MATDQVTSGASSGSPSRERSLADYMDSAVSGLAEALPAGHLPTALLLHPGLSAGAYTKGLRVVGVVEPRPDMATTIEQTWGLRTTARALWSYDAAVCAQSYWRPVFAVDDLVTLEAGGGDSHPVITAFAPDDTGAQSGYRKFGDCWFALERRCEPPSWWQPGGPDSTAAFTDGEAPDLVVLEVHVTTGLRHQPFKAHHHVEVLTNILQALSLQSPKMVLVVVLPQPNQVAGAPGLGASLEGVLKTHGYEIARASCCGGLWLLIGRRTVTGVRPSGEGGSQVG